MTSTIFQPPADALVTLLEDLGLAVEFNAHRWLPGPGVGFKPPAAIVELPDFERAEVEGAEPQLGSDLWQLEYPVSLVFALREAQVAQDRAALGVETFVRAVDADASLGGVAYESSVVGGEPEYDDNQGNPVVIYRTRVSVWFFAPTQQTP